MLPPHIRSLSITSRLRRHRICGMCSENINLLFMLSINGFICIVGYYVHICICMRISACTLRCIFCLCVCVCLYIFSCLMCVHVACVSSVCTKWQALPIFCMRWCLTWIGTPHSMAMLRLFYEICMYVCSMYDVVTSWLHNISFSRAAAAASAAAAAMKAVSS